MIQTPNYCFGDKVCMLLNDARSLGVSRRGDTDPRTEVTVFADTRLESSTMSCCFSCHPS